MAALRQAGRSQESDVLAGLRRFATLPDWLVAIVSPERVSEAMSKEIAEFASGQLALEGFEVKRARIKRDYWTALYKLAVSEPQTDRREAISLRGRLFPPGAEEPVQAPSPVPLAGPGWRCYLCELRLDL